MCAIIACVEKVSEKENWNNKFGDETVRKIYSLKDKRDTKKLISFLSHTNDAFREEAVMAFASIQDSVVLPKLHETLLIDTVENIRFKTAFTIGQTRSASSLPVLVTALDSEDSDKVKNEIYKAIGKCAKEQKDLDIFIPIDIEKDDSRLSAQAWGLYYAGLNGIFTNEKEEVYTLTFLLKQSEIPKFKLAASAYLSRFPQRLKKEGTEDLLQLAQLNSDIYVKSNLIKAFSRIQNKASIAFMKELITDSNADYRWKISALRSLNNLSYDEVAPIFWKALRDKNFSVRIIAADFLKVNVPKKDIRQLIDAAKDQENVRFKAALLERCKALDSIKEVDDYIYEVLNQVKGDYDKAFMLKAETSDKYDFSSAQNLMKTDTSSILRITAFTAYLEQLSKPEFVEELEINSEAKTEYITNFKNIVKEGDVGLTFLGVSALQDSNAVLRKWINDYTFLNKTLEKLTLPLEIEAWLAVQKILKAISKDDYVIPTMPKSNSTIDWDVLKGIKHEQEVDITTNKGTFTISLYTEETPGTVAMFVDLVKKGFYSGKHIHRHVPDFVIQGGCPRGDGFGGLPETIRSEFSLREYNHEGYVGIASAGKDTESCQFFITHSPTPHLNGKYTLFAKVVKGIDIVHQIEVGDTFLNITLN